MDKFSIVEVGDRRYRVRGGLGGSSGGHISRLQGSPAGGAEGSRCERVSVTVPRQLHRFLVGAKGSTIIRLREQSGAKITVPGERAKSDQVEIEGLPEQRAKAQALIEQLVSSSMDKVPYTHFISLPLTDTDVQRRVGDFKRDVGQGALRAVSAGSFSRPGSLHITLGMLRLLTPAEVTRAAELLKSLDDEIRQILDSRQLVVTVGRLAVMEADPARARVVYACVEDYEDRDQGRLQRVCDFVRDRFDREGYIDEKRPLKIHVTLVRAKPARGSDGDDSRGFTVDAKPLLKEFGALSFGVCRLGQIQIARRFTQTDSGAYESDGTLHLPA
ncbi:activating signal cointegrator 1 complex subunit [Coemansia nantahalensis]|nr:activating signal cointegrator 1 complex subunit [Coemansia nantahalensis]